MSVEFKCPSCGKKLFSYETRARKYEKIIKNCKKCGAEYADPRCYELALDGIPEDEFGYLQYVLIVALGAFFIWRGIHLLGVYQLGVPSSMQWLMPVVFLGIGVAAIIGAVISMISIKTGAKRRKLEKLLEESKIRMKDPTYKASLRRFGYNVPDDTADFYYN